MSASAWWGASRRNWRMMSCAWTAGVESPCGCEASLPGHRHAHESGGVAARARVAAVARTVTAAGSHGQMTRWPAFRRGRRFSSGDGHVCRQICRCARRFAVVCQTIKCITDRLRRCFSAASPKADLIASSAAWTVVPLHREGLSSLCLAFRNQSKTLRGQQFLFETCDQTVQAIVEGRIQSIALQRIENVLQKSRRS
ncbi:hypothetical protein SAMN05192544_105123 [Paraburkholderia hospita]|nr:hypothetical protein SAMN05192544_105123 [Paraburkholderia hospita]